MHLTRARRLSAGVAVAAVVLSVAPAPAFAAPVPPPRPTHWPEPENPEDVPPVPPVVMYVNNVTVPVGARSGTPVSPVWSAAGSAKLEKPKVVYEVTAGLAGVTLAGAEDFAECANTSPTTLVCSSRHPMALDATGVFGDFPAYVRAGDGAVAGTSGTVRVTFSALGLTPIVRTAEVRVAEAVDLEAGPAQRRTAAPGGPVDAPLVVGNAGRTAITGASVLFDHDFAIEPGARYRNCRYVEEVLASCTFAQPLEPGRTYAAAMPLKVRADTQAPSDAYGYRQWLTPAELADFHAFLGNAGISPGTPGAGDVLTLTEQSATARDTAQADPDADNNTGELQIAVAGRNGVDLAAVGARVSGTAGAKTTMAVGVRNVGRATLDVGRADHPAAVTAVTVPKDTAVLRAPEACFPVVRGQADLDAPGKPGAARYECHTDGLFPAGAAETYRFDVQLTAAAGRTTGAVAVNEPCRCDRFGDDVDPANDKARIVVTARAAAGADGPDDAAPGGTGAGAGLPITGPRGGAIAGVGAALVVLGTAVLLLTRRRRSSPTV